MFVKETKRGICFIFFRSNTGFISSIFKAVVFAPLGGTKPVPRGWEDASEKLKENIFLFVQKAVLVLIHMTSTLYLSIFLYFSN